MKNKKHWKRANRIPYLDIYDQFKQSKALLCLDKRMKSFGNQLKLPNPNTGDTDGNPPSPAHVMAARFPFGRS